MLGVIFRGETYGYEILTTLEQYGFEDLGEGTLYPVLARLHKNGYISCRRAKSPLGPVRKYYSITEKGKEYLNGFKENYRRVTASADAVLFEEKGREDRVQEERWKAGGEDNWV